MCGGKSSILLLSFTYFTLEVVLLHIPRSLHSCDFFPARFRIARSSKELLFAGKRDPRLLAS